MIIIQVRNVYHKGDIRYFKSRGTTKFRTKAHVFTNKQSEKILTKYAESCKNKAELDLMQLIPVNK